MKEGGWDGKREREKEEKRCGRMKRGGNEATMNRNRNRQKMEREIEGDRQGSKMGEGKQKETNS